MSPDHIFMDLDGCLIGPHGKTNASPSEVRELILKLQSKGIKVGLNSNRGKLDLVDVAGKFGMNGFNIIERGAAAISNGSVLVREFAEKMSLSEEYIPMKVHDIKHPEKNLTGIFYDYAREYTFSAYCLMDSKPDLGTARGLVALLEQEHPAYDSWMKDNGHVWCMPKSVDKGTPFTELFRDKVIMMIGHDRDDLPALAAAGYSAAPANLDDEISRHVHYVSPYPYTRGVADILQRILSGRAE